MNFLSKNTRNKIISQTLIGVSVFGLGVNYNSVINPPIQVNALSTAVTIDGISYNCDGTTAKITNVLYSTTGNLVIPSTITVNGTTYSVTSIGEYAFVRCTGLTSITIPNSVTSIGMGAFGGCTGLTSITIPNSVTSISDYTFDGCIGLTSITLPNSVTSISDYTFSGCTGLTKITIPNSVTSIGMGAFGGCTGLTSITIPNLVTSISSSAFSECTGLTKIDVDISNTAYKSIDGILFNKTETKLINYPLSKKTTSYTIPSSVTSIGDWAFDGCAGLTSIIIPNSVTSIGNGAFSGCTGLTSITIPNSVTSISDYTFSGCTGLTSITIPNSVTSISDYTFSGCTGLTSITIPNSVTSIGRVAFTNCTGLTSITIPNSVTSIGRVAFTNCTGLTSITILNSATSIYSVYPDFDGDNSFANCTSVEKYQIESMIYTLNQSAKTATVQVGTIGAPSTIKFNGSTYNVLIEADTTVPTLTFIQDITSETNNVVTITVTASDNVAIDSITKPYETIVKGNSTTYTVTQNGTYTFKATDTSGNVTTKSIVINNIDTIAYKAVDTAESTKTQIDVDRAKTLVDALSDNDYKTILQNRLNAVQTTIDKAKQDASNIQLLLDAQSKVKIAESTKMWRDLNDAKIAIDKLPSNVDKDTLQARLDKLRTQVSEDTQAKENIKDATLRVKIAEASFRLSNIKTYIANAQSVIDKLSDSAEKTELQTRLNAINTQIENNVNKTLIMQAEPLVRFAELYKTNKYKTQAFNTVNQITDCDAKTKFINRINAIKQ